MPDPSANHDLKRSPIHPRHEELGAKFGEYRGWLMPLEYEGQGALAEHEAVRERVGLFDVSHLGTLHVSGPGAAAYCDTVFTNDLATLGPGRARYTLLCNEDGGVIDDLIAYVYSPEDILLIPNAANGPAVAAVLADGAPEGITITDYDNEVAIFALEGPHSSEVLEHLDFPTDMGYMAFDDASRQAVAHVLDLDETHFDGEPFPRIVVCRTGYTGERGYEIIVGAAHAQRLFDAILAAGRPEGIVPCGLAALDALRTEMGYPSQGRELGPDISPWMARLGWAIGWEKPYFRGKAALMQQRASHDAMPWLMGIKLTDGGVPTSGMGVFSQPDREGDGERRRVGVVTSGTFSPILQTGIALALVDSSIEPGDRLQIESNDRVLEGEAYATPFVSPSVR